MINALAESVLETRHLYQQIAAIRHGAPEPPRRITTRVNVDPLPASRPSDLPKQPEAPKPEPPPQPKDTIDATWRPIAPPPAQSSTPGWVLPASLLAGPLLTLAGLGTGAYLFRSTPEPAPVVEQKQPDGIPLLEYLDERGYSRPAP
jgi:hypothetical protein